AELHALGLLRAEALLHEAGPEPARCAELGDLLEGVVVYVEEEGEARRELVDVEAALEARLDVADAVRDRERELLGGRRSGLADVIAADRDGVPPRDVLRAELDHVGHDTHRRARRDEPRVLRDELLQAVVLHGAADLVARDATDVGE